MNGMVNMLEAALWALQDTSSSVALVNFPRLLAALLMALLFSALGVLVLMISFALFARVLPFSIRKEVEEDQNVALAIVIGSIILGLSIIIAAAMLG